MSLRDMTLYGIVPRWFFFFMFSYTLTYGGRGEREAMSCLLHQSPKSYNKNSYSLAKKTWGLLFSWVAKSFTHCNLQRGITLLGITSIYRPLSYPFKHWPHKKTHFLLLQIKPQCVQFSLVRNLIIKGW